jgi:hypothetical protein
VTSRIEIKFLVTHEAKVQLLARWREYVSPAAYTDDHAVYPILSLYFDSPSLTFYHEKIDGEAIRSKVRLRGYGLRWANIDPCFLEVKHKTNTRIVKLRKNLGPFRPEFARPDTWLLDGDRKIAHAAALAELHHLRRVVQVFYLRQAYDAPHIGSRLRLTFDSQLLALHPEEHLDRDVLCDPRHLCLPDTASILEIKSGGDVPEWVLEGLHSCELQQQAISKYVLAVEKLGLQGREMGVYS